MFGTPGAPGREIFIENRVDAPQLLSKLRGTDGGREINNNKDLMSDGRVGESGNADEDEHYNDDK